MLAAMKMRRLDREYDQVVNAQIKTDPNKFEGLDKVLGLQEAEKSDN